MQLEGHDWNENRFFCLLSSRSLHTNYEVQDSLLNSLFGPGGEEAWQEAEKSVAPCLCGRKPVL